MTPATLRLALARAGLSNAEAARFLSVTDRTVNRWLAGDVDPTPAHIARLEALIEAQTKAVGEAMKVYRRALAEAGPVAGIDLWLPRTDADATARGWPCKGAHIAVLRRCREDLETMGLQVIERFIGDSPEITPPAPVARR